MWVCISARVSVRAPLASVDSPHHTHTQITTTTTWVKGKNDSEYECRCDEGEPPSARTENIQKKKLDRSRENRASAKQVDQIAIKAEEDSKETLASLLLAFIHYTRHIGLPRLRCTHAIRALVSCFICRVLRKASLVGVHPGTTRPCASGYDDE